MKDYPSIPRAVELVNAEFMAHIFKKLDGSNLRWEWNRKKKAFYKFGSRTVLFDKSHPFLGGAIDIFMNTLSEPLCKLATDERWESVTVFTEFWGARSLGGQHLPDVEDPKNVTLFDISPFKKGILGPSQYLKLVEKAGLEKFSAPYLGQFTWNRDLVEQVRRGGFEGAGFEGIIGKAGEGHKVIRAKAKTQAWIDAILSRYGEEQGRKIVES